MQFQLFMSLLILTFLLSVFSDFLDFWRLSKTLRIHRLSVHQAYNGILVSSSHFIQNKPFESIWSIKEANLPSDVFNYI